MSRPLSEHHRNALDAIVAGTLDSEGVFRRRDLASWGIDETVLRPLAMGGHIVRIRHGMYVDSRSWAKAADDPARRHRIELRAAIDSLGCPAFAHAESAALVHGLPLPFAAPRELNLLRAVGRDSRSLRQPSAHPISLPGVSMTVHDVGPHQVADVDGIPVTSLALTAVTAAARLHGEWPVIVLDSALWRAPDLRALLDVELELWPQLKGRKWVLRALELARSGAQTPLETVSRLALVRTGLPEPMLQHKFVDVEGVIGVTDMYWPTLGVIGEADGLIKYESREALVAEKRREDRLRALGFAVVRWGWDEIRERPHAVADRIRRASLWAA